MAGLGLELLEPDPPRAARFAAESRLGPGFALATGDALADEEALRFLVSSPEATVGGDGEGGPRAGL